MKDVSKYHWAITFILYTFFALYITYPLIFNLGNYITNLGDELLIAWIHNWVLHSFITNPWDIFNANIYFPYENTLAYSDLFLITSILGVLPRVFINEPIIITNFTIISSLIFLGFSIYGLAKYIAKDSLASFIAGLLVIFSPAVIDKFVHIQILAIAFVPIAILFFLKFINTKKTRYLILCMLFFVLQTLNSFLPGYFIIFSLLILFLFYLFSNKKKALQLLNRKNIFILLVSFLVLLPIVIPYYKVSYEFNYVRDIRETIHLALQPEDFFYSHPSSRLASIFSALQPKENFSDAEFKFGFIGFVFSVFAIVAFTFFVKQFTKKNWQENAIFTIALFGLIMSLGPFLHLFRITIHHPFPIPLPYVIFYYIVPGFQGMRNSSRWEMLFILAIAVIIAFVLNQVLKKVDYKKRLIIYAVIVLGIISEFNFPLHFKEVPQKKDFPQVYSWLSTTSNDAVIIEMPIYTWDMQPYVMNENMREYYSTLHFREMVNGASGFSPPPWQVMVRDLLIAFPNTRAIEKLSAMHVDYIIVHKDEYEQLHKDKFRVNNKGIPSGVEVISALDKDKSVKFVKKFGEDYVYQIK